MADGTNINAEWRLADFLDSLAAEVDLAQDTLSLKSVIRGMTVAVKGLSLDLAVYVRVDENGQVIFRCAEPGQPSPTILKLNLQETFQAQVEEVRKPLDETDLGLPLSTLPEITEPEIEALHTLSIFTVDDLRRACGTPALLSEVSRRTGIAEVRLRGWLGLPLLMRIVPAIGTPGQAAVIEGRNLGARDVTDAVLFQAIEAVILAWTETTITVEIPAGARSGPVYAQVDGSRSNVLLWQLRPPGIDLQAIDLTLEPPSPTETQVILFRASIVNRSNQASGPFSVEWLIDDDRILLSVEAELAPGQSGHYELRRTLAPGSHRVLFTIDPENMLPLVDPGKGTQERAFSVAALPLRLVSIVPTAGTVPSSLSVELQGSGFQAGCTVSFGPAIMVSNIDVETSEQITAQVSVAKTAELGSRDVTVTLPDGRGTATLRDGFTLTPPFRQLSLRSVTPASGVVPSKLTLVLKGTGFETGCTVSLGAAITVSRVDVESPERITIQISIAKTAALGPRDVIVSLPSGLGSDTLRAGFTLTPRRAHAPRLEPS